MTTALVTGSSGYVGTHVVAALLRQGQPVRATVRTTSREADLRASMQRAGVDDAALEFALADLSSDDGWAAAMSGVAEVYHVASPIPTVQPDNPDDLVVPARDGSLRVLRAARDAGVRRVVLTSSFAAVGYTRPADGVCTEANWTDPDAAGLAPYPKSKVVAERAAWDFVEREGNGLELVVMNPTFILGPTLTSELGSSMTGIKMMATGEMKVLRRQRFGVVDVRDVADGHLLAMATAGAAGKRYLLVGDGPLTTWLGLADLLRGQLGAAGDKVPTEEVGDEPLPLSISNQRAHTDLGWQPRPLDQTVADTLASLRTLGAL